MALWMKFILEAKKKGCRSKEERNPIARAPGPRQCRNIRDLALEKIIDESTAKYALDHGHAKDFVERVQEAARTRH